MAALRALAALALLAAAAEAFYLPGVAPQDFVKGDPIAIKVNKLSSAKNLPFEYYSLPYCRPPVVKRARENLGEVLRGDRIETSPFAARFREDVACAPLCRVRLSHKQSMALKARIADEYRVNMVLDNLPVGMARAARGGAPGARAYERGFPVGFKEGERYFLNNHLRFTVLYHEDTAAGAARIVGFEVEPSSVAHQHAGEWDAERPPALTTCGGAPAAGDARQSAADDKEVIFSYDVLFKPSDVRWASRWDTYLASAGGDDQVHWFSIVNSAMIVLFLAGLVAAIMLRTLRRDISAYNALDAEEAAEESGWKLVHGDVFRPPPAAEWLAALAGAGAQLLLVAVATIAFAALGFLSPANRGGLTTAALLLFALSGSVAGYASARVYKRFRGAARRSVALRAALAFPAAASLVFLSVNAAAAAKRSSGAAPFGTLAALLFLWAGVNAPLALLGAYLGGRGAPPEDPVRTNKIPRQVPPQPWFVHPLLAAAVGGVLPFGAVFIELFFILAAAWTGTFYYLFGFLALAFAVLVATCAEVAVVLAYFQLCAEDYRWAWRAFLTSGASAGYLFAYSAYYFVAKLDIVELAPAAVYFGYMAIFSAAFFLLTGAVGFFATAAFVRRVYSALKID